MGHQGPSGGLVNRLEVTGHVLADPLVALTPTGDPVATLTVADRLHGLLIRCTARGALARAVVEFVAADFPIFLTGTLVSSTPGAPDYASWAELEVTHVSPALCTAPSAHPGRPT